MVEMLESALRRHAVWRAPGMPPLLALTALGFAGYALLMPVAPMWVVSGGADTSGAGAVNAVLMLFTVIGQLLMGVAVRALGWSVTLSIGLTLLGGMALAHMVSPDFTWTLVTTALRGVGFGVLTVCGAMAVAFLVAPSVRGRAIGAYGLAIAVPQLVLTPAGPWLAEEGGFTLVFVLSALPLLAIAGVPLVSRHINQPNGSASGEDVGRRLPAQAQIELLTRIWRPVLALVLITSGGGALLTFAAHIAPSAEITGVALVCFTGAAAVSRWGFGWVADHWGPKRFIGPLLALAAIALVGVGMATELTPGAAQNAMLFAASGLLGVTYGGLQNLTLVLAFAVGGEGARPQVSVAWNVGFDAGTGVGALAVGQVAGYGSFFLGFVLLASLALVAVIALVLADAWMTSDISSS